MTHKIRIVAIIAVLGLLLSPGNVTGQVPAFVGRQASAGSAFTYQGQLKAGSSPITGNCNMAFRLYDQSTGGNQVGTAITTTVPISNGLFSVVLDFGRSAFDGQARYLQIAIKCGGDSGFTTLGSRQELTPAPYALFALNNVPLSGGTMTGDLTTTRLKAGSPANVACNGDGDVCAQNDLVADDAVTQSRTGNGTVKAGAYLYCSNSGSFVRRSFNNVNSVPITVTNGSSLGKCTVDFGFQVDDRFVIATVTHPDTPLGVTVSSVFTTTAQLFVWHGGNATAVGGGDVFLIVY